MRRRPPRSTLLPYTTLFRSTLLGLLRHMTDVERGWFRVDAAGGDAPPIYYDDANPDGEFDDVDTADRSEEHTSELQSRQYLVCRLLLEKTNTLRSTSLQNDH